MPSTSLGGVCEGHVTKGLPTTPAYSTPSTSLGPPGSFHRPRESWSETNVPPVCLAAHHARPSPGPAVHLWPMGELCYSVGSRGPELPADASHTGSSFSNPEASWQPCPGPMLPLQSAWHGHLGLAPFLLMPFVHCGGTAASGILAFCKPRFSERPWTLGPAAAVTSATG